MRLSINSCEPCRRQCLAEVETLHGIAALFAQQIELILRFHAFRDDLEVLFMRHVDDGAGDGGIVDALGDVAHIFVVQHESVDGVQAKRFERRVTGVEIVDGHSYAERMQCPQRFLRAISGLGQHGFGDADTQQFRRQAAVMQSGADVRQQILLQKLRR